MLRKGFIFRQVVTTFDQSTPQNITNTSVTSYFMGGLYEVTDNTVTKYYSISGMTVAVDDGTG